MNAIFCAHTIIYDMLILASLSCQLCVSSSFKLRSDLRLLNRNVLEIELETIDNDGYNY